VSGEEGLPLIDATWRAWTYVADAGNHADSSGLGPRIVSVCISFGGEKGLGVCRRLLDALTVHSEVAAAP